jgi:hypothetical protein
VAVVSVRSYTYALMALRLVLLVPLLSLFLVRHLSLFLIPDLHGVVTSMTA